MNNPKPTKVRIKRSDVENFKTSVKIGDKFLRECLTREIVKERKSTPQFERVVVVKKYRHLARVKSISSSGPGPIKTMTYTEMLMQRRGVL